MNIRADVRLDQGQFFDWANRQDRKYELTDGRAVLQPYVTLHHARLCTNIMAGLVRQLDQTKFDVVQGDFAVETGPLSIRYADVMVQNFGHVGTIRSTRDALVLAEVLSNSTMHIDFHEKLDEYRRLPTLGTYFICAQDEARVWIWTRTETEWPEAPQILESLDAILDLPILSVALPLSEIYRNVVVA